MTEALNFRLNLDIQDLDPDSPPTTFRIEELPKKKVGTMWDPVHCLLMTCVRPGKTIIRGII